MSSGTGFFGSPIYKKVMSKVYGIGAAVAIVGALFKIMHFPGASIMLVAGLGVEALIFFLSAFEPPHEMPDWSLVYPELVGLESHDAHGHDGIDSFDSTEEELHEKPAKEIAPSVPAPVAASSSVAIPQAQLDPAAMAKLGKGIDTFAHSIEQLANVSEISEATKTYLSALNSASGSIGSLTEVQTETTNNIRLSSEALNESYVVAAKAVADGGKQISESLSKSGENMLESVQVSGKQLADVYKTVGENFSVQIEKITTVHAQTNQELNQSSEALCQSYVTAANAIADGGTKVSNSLAKTGENMVEAVQLSGKQLTDVYKIASENVSTQIEKITAVHAQTNKEINQSSEALCQSYVTAANAIAEGGIKVSDALSKSGNSVVEAMQQSGKQFTNVYNNIEQTMSRHIEQMSEGAALYSENIHITNNKLSSINSIYELHLASINNQVNEVNKLVVTLGELNSIYGNMLNLVK